MDSFYKVCVFLTRKRFRIPADLFIPSCGFVQVLTPEQHELAKRNEHNFDHPSAFDFDLLYEKLKMVKDGTKIDIPVYNFKTHRLAPYHLFIVFFHFLLSSILFLVFFQP